MVRAPGAIRMTFTFSGRDIHLESIQRLIMRALPSHDTGSFESRSGFWIELRDDNETVLYRRVLHNPIQYRVEIYPEGGEGEFTRVPVADPQGTFDVVVPDLPEARQMMVYASLPVPAPESETETERAARVRSASGQPAELVARFSIPDD
jgi:hypothetical protein